MNNFRPTASQRKEEKVKDDTHIQSVEWESLVGKRIYFWSWTIEKVKDVEKKGHLFIFHTTKQIGFNTVERKIHKVEPTWNVQRWSPFVATKSIRFVVPYMLGHAVEVKCPEPTKWLTVMETVTKALEDVL